MANNKNIRRGGRRNYAALFFAVFFITLAVMLAVVAGVWAIVKHAGSSVGKDPVDTGTGPSSEITETDVPATESTPVTETEAPKAAETEPVPVYTGATVSVSMTEEELQTGSLILCNPDHEYNRPDERRLPTIYSQKTRNYKVSSSETCLDGDCISAVNALMADFNAATGKNDVLINNAYRTYDEQMNIYSAYVNRYGIGAAEGNVALGGCSDHNTGYGFDFNVYTADGVTETLASDSAYNWILNNCYKYGIVRRYSTPKTSVTKLYEEWHFRYVGVPHAYYMRKYDYCLEEYIAELMNYPSDGSHLLFSDDAGNSWEIFAAPVNNSGSCVFDVPEGAEYTVSGTNTGYAVVTIKR